MSEPPTSYELDKRISLMEATVKLQTAELEEINTSLKRLVWAAILALFAAGMQFIIKGGLSP